MSEITHNNHINDYRHIIAVSSCAHLYAGLGQVDADGQPLSHTHIWILCLLEGLLQSLQLRHSERCAAAALLLLVAIPGLQN